MIRELAKVAVRHRSSASLLWRLGASEALDLLPKSQCSNRRHFSTQDPSKPISDDQDISERFTVDQASDFLCSNKARIMVGNLGVSTKDFGHEYGLSQLLESTIEKAKQATQKDFNLTKLMELYKLVRPELVSRMLIHNHKFLDPNTHWLKYQTHALSKNKPKFTTCFDLMVELVGMREEYWVFYLNYLSQERIAVIEEWISISTTEHLLYDHGLKDFEGIRFYKGEADASWDQASSTADLSNLIWHDDRVISATTYLGVGDCHSIVQSEAKASFAILTKAKELGIENFVLWTDNKAIRGVLSETRPIPSNDQDWELFMALESLRSSFKRLVVMCVPREMMKFSDGMLRKPMVMYPRYMKQSAKQWAYHLNGLPAFKLSLTHEATKQMNSFGKPVDGEPVDNRILC